MEFMVTLEPFAAWYYNTQQVDLSGVIVPPFDVISTLERRKFFRQHPYNFAKIILGKNREGNYKKAGRLFHDWKKKNIFVQDRKSHFYVWEQMFNHHGKRLRRLGLVAQVALDDFHRHHILPHEKTFEAPILDRLQIAEETKANLSPVFMMYDGRKRVLENKIIRKCEKPFLQFHNSEGVKSRIWRIEDADLEKDIRDYFRDKKLYIVDGHHRFATALAFREKNKKKQNRSLDFVLAVICNMADPALVIYPIHRILPRQKEFDRESYLKHLSHYFFISKKKRIPLKNGRWGLLFRDACYELSFRPRKKPTFKKDQAVSSLDVFILQEFIIPKEYRNDLRYTKAIGKNLKQEFLKLKEGKYEAIWLVRQPSLDQIKRVSDHHEVMPQKSTFFYPKVFAGALIRCFDGMSELVLNSK